jgi:hypothetical protein
MLRVAHSQHEVYLSCYKLPIIYITLETHSHHEVALLQTITHLSSPSPQRILLASHITNTQ